MLTVYFYVTEIPIWLLFFALGVPSDSKVVKMIDLDIEDSAIANILGASIYDADKKYEGFRKEGNAIKHIKELMQDSKFPPTESVEECVNNYLFSHLKSLKRRPVFSHIWTNVSWRLTEGAAKLTTGMTSGTKGWSWPASYLSEN